MSLSNLSFISGDWLAGGDGCVPSGAVFLVEDVVASLAALFGF